MPDRSAIKTFCISAAVSLALHATALGVLAVAMSGVQIRWPWESTEKASLPPLESASAPPAPQANPPVAQIPKPSPEAELPPQPKTAPPAPVNAPLRQAALPSASPLVKAPSLSGERKVTPSLPKIQPGSDKSTDPLAVAWISYDDFEKLVAKKGAVDQAGQQRNATPVPGAPALPNPNSDKLPASGDGNPIASAAAGGGDGPAEPKVVEAAINRSADSPGTVTPDLPPAQAPASISEPPRQNQPIAAVAEQPISPLPAKTFDAAPAPRPAASSGPLSEGEKLLQTIARSLPADPTQPGLLLPPAKQNDVPAVEPLTQAKPEPVVEKTNTAPPSKPQQVHPLAVTSDVIAAAPVLPVSPPASQPAVSGPFRVAPVNLASANPARDGPTPRSPGSRDGPRPLPSGTGTRSGGRASSLIRTNSESYAVSLTVSPLPIKLGSVVTAEGVHILTAVPDLSVVAKFIIPNNPTARLVFDKNGLVTEVSFIKGCGNPTWDSPILACLYKWRATGSKLAQINGPFEMEVHILLVDE